MTPVGLLSTTEEREHAERVLSAVREQIEAAGGWLPFDRYMELALYAPGLGYYSAGSIKIGPAGDFTTAPEVSSLFSQCVAQQCAEVLGAADAGDIIEVGAGTGRMAFDLLLELETLGSLPSRYQILEVSADLRARQQERVSKLPAEIRRRVLWLDALPTTPIEGVILANEVLDALPCKRFCVSGALVLEVGVELDAAASESALLRLGTRPADEALTAELKRLFADLPESPGDGYLSEVCPRVDPWVRTLASCLKRGAMLLFDYGLPRAHYYHPDRSSGTLRCHFRHYVHDDPLAIPGMQDITAWVDFTRVAEAAVDAGLEVAGFATQAAFLLGTGITARISQEQRLEHLRRSAEAQRLLLPGEMGEAFKVMALTRDLDRALSGFAIQDLRRLL